MKYEFDYDSSAVGRCLLCHRAECTKACPYGVPVARVLRSLYFDNFLGAASLLNDAPCAHCDAPCERSCVLASDKAPVSIREIFEHFQTAGADLPEHRIEDVDLSCSLCGVTLENPFIIASSTASSSYDMCRRAFEEGWAGVSFKTICSFPQHEASPRFSAIKGHGNAFLGFKNIEQLSDHGVQENMEDIRRLHEDYPNKVIISSIMGRNLDEWAQLAEESERAGAAVVELNFSCPNMEDDGLGITIGQSEELVERFTSAVRKATSLPVLAKLTPNIADMVPIALAARRGGADGIAAINTINSITGVDLDTLVAEPAVRGKSIVGGYSGNAVKPIALRFISDLSRAEGLEGMHLSGIGGVQTWRDALEFILLGAGSVQVTTAVMEYGYRIINDLVQGLEEFLQCRGVASVSELVGAASKTVVDHQDIERDTLLLPVVRADRCNGCGRCYLSCRDGGHQAIAFDEKNRLPKIDARKCVGCHLCRLVCPTSAIGVAPKAIRR